MNREFEIVNPRAMEGFTIRDWRFTIDDSPFTIDYGDEVVRLLRNTSYDETAE